MAGDLGKVDSVGKAVGVLVGAGCSSILFGWVATAVSWGLLSCIFSAFVMGCVGLGTGIKIATTYLPRLLAGAGDNGLLRHVIARNFFAAWVCLLGLTLAAGRSADYNLDGPSEEALVAEFPEWRSQHAALRSKFEVWRHDDWFENKYKGYIFSPTLDGLPQSGGDTTIYYRHITGGWYVYTEMWNV
jgi:hypothetical protein